MTSPKRPFGVIVVAVLSALQGVVSAVSVFLTLWYYLRNFNELQRDLTIFALLSFVFDLLTALLLIPAGLHLWQLKRSGIRLAQWGWAIRLIQPFIVVAIVLMTAPARSWNCSVDIITLIILVYVSTLWKRSEFSGDKPEVLAEMQDVTG